MCGGARGGRERSPGVPVAPLVLHAAPPPPHGTVGEVRRAAAGAAVVARERKRAAASKDPLASPASFQDPARLGLSVSLPTPHTPP